MMEIDVKTKKWGNSLGITIPNEVVREMNLKPNEGIRVLVEKPESTTVRDIFKILKFKKPTKILMKEIDKELDIAM